MSTEPPQPPEEFPSGPERGPEGPESPSQSPQWPPAPAAAAGPSQMRFSDYRRGMKFPLRPMDFGQVLDATVNLYRANWKTFMAIAAIPLIPLFFLQSFFTSRFALELGAEGLLGGSPFEPTSIEPSPFPPGGEFGTQLQPDFGVLVPILVLTVAVLIVQFGFVQPFITAAAVKAAADCYEGGEPTVGSTYKYALRRFHSILWVGFLTSLVVFPGLLLCLIPGIIFAIKFIFGSSAVVIEGERGTKAMGRSWRLSAGYFWKVLGLIVVGIILAFVLGSIIGLLFNLPALLIGPNAWFLEAAGNSLGAILTTPFTTILYVLLYFDLRIRKEGLDLAVMAEELTRG
ncbi:MAG: hypothetical protein ACRDI1_01105 [Actinomycetota bacterium]